jgi:hypothetical protein
MTPDAAAGAARPQRPLVLDADGGTALPLDAEPLRERRPPRIPLRLLVAALVGVLLLTGSAFGTRAAADVDPSAFAIFEEPASADDEQAMEDLVGIGAPMIGEPRVLLQEGSTTVVAVRAPSGTAARLRASGGFPIGGEPTAPEPQRDGDAADTVVPRSAEVCVWMFQRFGPVNGRCASMDEFALAGIASSVQSETLESVVLWAADGSTTVQLVPLGPTTLAEVQALGIPAIDQLDSLPVISASGSPTIDRARELIEDFGFGEPVIEPRAVAMTDEWSMIGGLFSPEPGGGLAVCVIVTPVAGGAIDDSVATGGCSSIPRFQQQGSVGSLGGLEGSVTWEWLPDGSTAFSGGLG